MSQQWPYWLLGWGQVLSLMTPTEVCMMAPWHTSVSQIHLPPVSVSPRESCSTPPPPQHLPLQGLSRLARRPAHVPIKLLLTLGPRACEILCAPFKSKAFIFLNPQTPEIKPRWPSKPNALRVPPPDTRHPGWGSGWGSDLSLFVGDPLQYNYSPSLGVSPPGGAGT